MTIQRYCKICEKEDKDLGDYCESCAMRGHEIYLMFEGNISKSELEMAVRLDNIGDESS